MDRILDKARTAQNFLDKIANAIPGFSGYREKELRRDADRLQREHLAARLEACKKALNEAADAATRTGNLAEVTPVELARKRLEKVVNRIRYADRGYAGFFDTVKVDEAVLARVYEFDLSLLQGVEAVAAAGSNVTAMTAAIEALDGRLADREAILSGVK
jgi:hypothetical protein